MKNLNNKFILTALLFLLCGKITFALYTPVTVTGFNADVVADIAGNAGGSTTDDYDGVNYVFMSSSFNTAGPSFMPNAGLVTSVIASTPGLTYQLASYTSNNSLRLPSGSSGALTFVTPQSAQTIYALGSTGSGVGTATITITFTDFTTQVFTGVVFPDWFGGANFAIQGMGRTHRVTNAITNSSTDPRLYQAPLALLPSNYGKLVQSVSFSNSGGILNIMAISIDTPPIPCTGAPVAGTAVASLTNPCPGVSVNVSLVGSTFASNLAYQWQQASNCVGGWSNISGLSNPTAITSILTVTGAPSSNIAYRCIVTCTNSGLSTASTSTCVVVQPWSCTSPCYPASAATNSPDQDIFNVTMGSLNNTTDCASPLIGSQGNATGTGSMYADFGGPGGVPSPIIYKGLTQPFSLSIGTCGSTVPSSVKIYIDFNHNASFTDTLEEVYSNNAIPSVTPTAILNDVFTTPSFALSGCTRMRVVMMSTWIGTVSSTGTYPFGETEDYTINIIQPTSYDPTITSIVIPSGNCFTNNEIVNSTLSNYGSQPIDLSINPITVTLNVNSPTGSVPYTTVISSGILSAYGSNTIPFTFNGVDMYAGGTYSLNTTLTLSGLVNGVLSNDSLATPISILNFRPTGGPDYQLCSGSIIPFGQGLTVSGCATPINDSVEITFTLSSGQPPICTSLTATPTAACEFATAVLPTLPAGSAITSSGILTVTNLASASLGCILCTWPNEKRFSLFQGSAPPSALSTFFPGAQGNSATTGANAQGYTYTNSVSSSTIGTIYSTLGAGGVLKMGSWNTYNTTANTHVINYGGNPTVAKLKIYYTYVPASFEWYKDSIGGPVLYNYSPFNPIGVPGSGITNSNTPGIYPFYAACSGSSTCRVPVNLVIHPTPSVVQDTLTGCEYAVGSNSAIFDLSTIDGPVSAFASGVTVSYFGDQALFLPITNSNNDTSSTNFIYSMVTDTSTGCFSTDSVLLQVVPRPQFLSTPLYGNACAPNSIDVASLINPFTTTAGADTLYFEDPAYTIPYPNPHSIFTQDTVYMALVTNTIPSCTDSAMAIIDIIPASNYIVFQDTLLNYSNCGAVGCGNIILGDGNTETLFTSTDCRKIATVTDLTNSIDLGSTSICEDIDCSVQTHNGQPYVNRHYQITPTTNDSAYVCLYFIEQDFQDFNSYAFSNSWPILNPSTNLCINQVDDGDITTPGHTAVSIPNSAITSTFDPLTNVWQVCFKVDSFSYFYCSTCNPLNIPLGVNMIDFTAVKSNNTSLLNWTTLSEQNNDYFVVERSKDGVQFTSISNEIGTKALNGNSNSPLHYSYTDQTPLIGHNYYRLKQVDIDGKTTLTQVIDVYFGDETIVNMYPNPVKNILFIEINSPKASQVETKIVDATGRLVRTILMNLGIGKNENQIELNDLADGVYLIQVVNNHGLNFTQTIRKQ